MALPLVYSPPPNQTDYDTFLQTNVGVPGSALAYALPNPGAAPVLTEAPGGTLAAATYYAKYTYTNAGGETLASAEASLAVAANNLLVVASPPSIPGAAAWSVYVASTSGSETRQAQGLQLGSSWTLPTSGLVSGAAVPGANTTADSPYIPYTLQLALDIMNQTLAAVAPNEAVLATYNLAADILINIGPDIPGQTYFADLRSNWNLGSIVTGVVSATADESTSTSLLNPEQLDALTLADLQRLKTPYGRAYMAFAQSYGQTLWGLT